MKTIELGSGQPRAPIPIVGVPASPYTRKMIAAMRYRRIAYRFIQTGAADQQSWPTPKIPLLPTLYFADENGDMQPATDSSPIIRRLEKSVAGRAIIPSDPVLALLDMLLEDYGDEWLTKAMFHYRWQYDADIKRSAHILPHWRHPNVSDAQIAQHSQAFADRQIGRLGMVGSNEITTPVIEDSYHRFLDIFDAHVTDHPFLMGTRPGASDFAVFGQLTQLIQFDPTPMAIALGKTGRTYAWVSFIDDLSGLEPDDQDWLNADAIPNTLHALLTEMGRTYAPVMLANERAVVSGASEVHGTVDDKPWRQRPFPYQAKCLRWLREAASALSATDRARFDAVIENTGLNPLFATNS